MTLFCVILSIGCTFIWCGLVLGISFLESWLKFRAPNVTLAIGLGIGKIVFAALNRIEWAIIILISSCCIILKTPLNTHYIWVFIIVLSILILQTFLLLPALSKRANLAISGKRVKVSNLHLYFISLEFLKLILLIIAGILQIKTFINL